MRRRLGGLPGGGQRLADAGVVGAALGRGAGAVDVGDQALDHRAFLQQQYAPDRLGRVRGEHRLDVHPRQQRLQFGQAHAGNAQFVQDRVQAAGLRRAALPLVVAAAADAVHPLGQVGGPEIGGERAHQRLRVRQRHPRQPPCSRRAIAIRRSCSTCARNCSDTCSASISPTIAPNRRTSSRSGASVPVNSSFSRNGLALGVITAG